MYIHLILSFVIASLLRCNCDTILISRSNRHGHEHTSSHNNGHSSHENELGHPSRENGHGHTSLESLRPGFGGPFKVIVKKYGHCPAELWGKHVYRITGNQTGPFTDPKFSGNLQSLEKLDDGVVGNFTIVGVSMIFNVKKLLPVPFGYWKVDLRFHRDEDVLDCHREFVETLPLNAKINNISHEH